MIRSFRCRDTRRLFEGHIPPRFRAIERVARRKLEMLHAATCLDDLRVPPGNRLHPLLGERRGQWSLRVNDRYRICFRWEKGDAWDVEIVDYH